MTVRNNLVIGSMFHNLRKWLSLRVYNHISGSQMTLRNVAIVKLRPGEHGRVMYICIFYKNKKISYIIFPNNNPSVSHIWHCSNTPLFRKQGHFLFRDALVRVTSSLSRGSALYFIPGHICVSHIPQEFQPLQGDYVQNWLFYFAPENCAHPGNLRWWRDVPYACYSLIGW